MTGRAAPVPGRPLESELGFGWSEALHPEDRTRVLELCERALQERTPFEAQFRIRRSDGTWHWIAAKGVPLPDEHDPEGFVASCVDITEFLATVSHELRSPLNGIKSWTHVLENLLRDAPAPVQRALAGIMIGVDQQVRLIDLLADPKSATPTAAESDTRPGASPTRAAR